MQVLIFKEKHGDRIYDASNHDKILCAMVYTFNERYNDGWYDTSKDFYLKRLAENDLKKPSFAEERIPEFPEILQASARKQWSDYKRDRKFAEEALDECDRIVKLYEEQDAEKIYLFMKTRDDGEYEGWELESIEVAPPLKKRILKD